MTYLFQPLQLFFCQLLPELLPTSIPQGFVQDPPLLGDYAGNGAFSGPGAVSGPTYDSASSESVPASLAQNTTEYQWNEGFQYNYYISSTCNTTNANLITIGQNQGLEVAQHARVFLLHYGNYSDTFIKYFGFSPSYAPLGVYDSIANGDRSHLLYTCEDVENKCSTIGHSGIYIHNPDNITICDKAYFNRLYNDQICTQGYTVDGSDPTTTVAGQYIEYLLSTGKFGGMDLHHYDDTYEGVLKLATTDPVKAQKTLETSFTLL